MSRTPASDFGGFSFRVNVVTVSATVILAAGAGKRAVKAIHRDLSGNGKTS